MHRTPINIGRQVQLFFDNQMIEFVQALTRRMHQPEKHAQNPLLKQDQPWEKSTYIRTGTVCVAHDARENLFKCWYCDYAWDYDRFMGRGEAHQGLDEHIAPGWFDTTDNKWLYAESADGIHWRKPLLDYRTHNGRKTNICLGREDYGQVYISSMFLDTLESDESRRFKALHWRQADGNMAGGSQIRLAYSADGRTWDVEPEIVKFGEIAERVIGDEFMVWPDTARGQYILNVRQRAMAERLDHMHVPCRVPENWEPPQYMDDPLLMCKRRVFMTNSNDLLRWPTLREMMVPSDTEDAIDEEFYSMPIVRIGDLYIGFLNVLHATDNTMNVRLLYSRDAFNWKYVERGRPFLDVDDSPGSWEPYLVEVGNTIILRDDAVYIYYGASACHHDWWMWGEKEGLDMPDDEPGVCKTALGLATLRPEGFVSIDSTVRPGLMLTRPFVSDGSQLVVNVQCEPNGYFDVELTDADDNVIAGYERAACDRFTGDEARHTVTWNGASQLPCDVLAKGAKLRFFSQRASLYSFRIVSTLKSR